MSTLFQKSSAVLSDCGRYRYSLTRAWDESKPVVVFCMFNPSTADAEQDDPTIRRCIRFARDWGHGGLTVVNLLAYRTPYPTELKGVADPVGPANDAALIEACRDRRVVAAWGASVERYAPGRPAAVLKLLASLPGCEVLCLGTTADGSPRHPLYVPAVVQPVAFPARRREGEPVPHSQPKEAPRA